MGAAVTGVCGAHNASLVRSLGAESVVDYRVEDFTRGPARYDVVLDVAGGHGALAVRRVVARDGILVVVGGSAGRWVQPAGHVFSALAVGPLISARVGLADTVGCARKKECLTALTSLIEDGSVTPVVDRAYPFAELPAAVRYQAAGHARGKVVVTMPG